VLAGIGWPSVVLVAGLVTPLDEPAEAERVAPSR
jgi:hypothetical protein